MGKKGNGISCSSLFLDLILFIFGCIALTHSDSDVIYAACGHTLRDMLMALLILCVVFIVGGAIVVSGKCDGPVCNAVSGVCSIVFVVGVLLVLGAFTAKASIGAFNIPNCTAAMSSPLPSAYTGVPLLGIMGLITGVNSFCIGAGLVLFVCSGAVAGAGFEI